MVVSVALYPRDASSRVQNEADAVWDVVVVVVVVDDHALELRVPLLGCHPCFSEISAWLVMVSNPHLLTYPHIPDRN